MEFQRILVILDKPKHKQVALDRAVDLAKRTGAHLDLVAFVHHPVYEHKDVYDQHQRQAMRKALMHERRDFVQDLVRDAGIEAADVKTHTVWTADIAGWVRENAPRLDSDLVIKSVHRSRTITHTPTDWHLLRTCPVPLLLAVKRRYPARARVLATLDLRRLDAAHQRLNAKVMGIADSWAKTHESEVDICFVIEQSDVLTALDIVDTHAHVNQVKRKIKPTLDGLAKDWDVPADRVHLPVGKVGQCVNSVVDRIKAELVVMGTTARRGVKGMVLGNSAEKVLSRVNCDVLALKP